MQDNQPDPSDILAAQLGILGAMRLFAWIATGFALLITLMLGVLWVVAPQDAAKGMRQMWMALVVLTPGAGTGSLCSEYSRVPLETAQVRRAPSWRSRQARILEFLTERGMI